MSKYRTGLWRPVIALASAAACALAACAGEIGEAQDDPSGAGPGGGPARPGTPGGPGPTPGGTPTGTTPPPPGMGTMPPRPATYRPAPAGLRRLTRSQYASSIRDLLGPDVTVPADLEPDTVLSGFASIGAAVTPFPATAAEKLESAALAIGQQALADPARRTRLVPCVPASVRDEACAKNFITAFGRRAWRRPLLDDEATRYAVLARTSAETAGDFWQGLSYALAALLQSPHFLYRVELGAPGAVKGERTFDDWELATRLSFFLWNTTPDDTLLAAAAARALTKPGGLRTQAERLLASPRAQLATREFFSELLRLEGLDDLEQNPTSFPQATKTLGPSMREETLRVVDDIVSGPMANYRRVFDTTTTFVNAELARLYGLPAPAGAAFARASLPADGLRAGLLGQASFLALNAHETTTSPTRRGKFVREVLLCQTIPLPPPEVMPTLPPDPKGGAITMRERLAMHDAPGCASCHRAMDPIGLAFENFDAIGRLRTTDAGKTIDASGELDGKPFRTPRELSALLRDHPGIDECLVRGLFRYAMGHIETDGEEVLIQRIATLPGPIEQRFKTLILGVVDSDGFRIAAESL